MVDLFSDLLNKQHMRVENNQKTARTFPEKILHFFEEHSPFEIAAITTSIAGATMFISAKDALLNENWYAAAGYGLATIGFAALAYKNVKMDRELRVEKWLKSAEDRFEQETAELKEKEDTLWYVNDSGEKRYYSKFDILPPENE